MQNELFEYALRLGDNNLILGQQLGNWCGHAPDLELDITLANLALDIIGQARLFLSLAGEIEGKGRDEDVLAYHRDVADFRNVLLVEQPNGDWGATIVRQFLYTTWQQLFLTKLVASTDERFAAIAQKAIKEVAYHARFASEWMKRLGDGTEESHNRVQDALNSQWRFADELFDMDNVDRKLAKAGIGVDLAKLQKEWDARIDTVLADATLARPEPQSAMFRGRNGHHTEHLGHLLSDMQFLQRAYPGATW